jgi:hypothetical protein
MYVPLVLRFKNSTFYPQNICLFCLYLRKNTEVLSIQLSTIGFYKWGDKCLLRGTNWVFK